MTLAPVASLPKPDPAMKFIVVAEDMSLEGRPPVQTPPFETWEEADAQQTLLIKMGWDRSYVSIQTQDGRTVPPLTGEAIHAAIEWLKAGALDNILTIPAYKVPPFPDTLQTALEKLGRLNRMTPHDQITELRREKDYQLLWVRKHIMRTPCCDEWWAQDQYGRILAKLRRPPPRRIERRKDNE